MRSRTPPYPFPLALSAVCVAPPRVLLTPASSHGPDLPLRLGVQGVAPRVESLNGVLRGSLPLQRVSLGQCIIRGSTPSLWFPVADLLGFEISCAIFPSSEPFRTVMSQLYPSTAFVNRVPADISSPDLVFADDSSLPSFTSPYWRSVSCPHLVAHTDSASAPLAEVPSGWISHTLSLAHCQVGGATAGTFHVSIVMRATDYSGCVEAPAVPQRPWSTISHSLDCRAPTPPLPSGPAAGVDPTQRVVTLSDGSLGSWGLLPVPFNSSAKVTMPSDRSRSGWGRRALTAGELSDLWNTPISIQDAFVKHQLPSALASFTSLPPAKVLATCADVLCTHFLRGGFGLWSAEPQAKRLRSDDAPMLQNTPVPRPVLGKQSDGNTLASSINLAAIDAKVQKQDGQKADDAEVPTFIWENQFRDSIPAHWDGAHPTVFPLHPDWRSRLDSYRTLGICYWRRNVCKSYWKWVKQKLPSRLLQRALPHSYVRWTGASYQWTKNGRTRYGADLSEMLEHPRTKKDWDPARECISKASHCSWWEWHQGSRLFFWRWPKDKVAWARDGQQHYITKELPNYTRAQKAPKTADDRTKVWKKLAKVRERLYINVGLVLSLMHWFYVLKGETDIRMVYNGTASGINDCLFAPHFGLPILLYVVRSLMSGYFQADMDIGEMFPNFMLGERLRPYSGVDVSHIRTTEGDLSHHPPGLLREIPDWEKARTRKWERWERNWMGLRDSPYRSIQMAMVARDMAYGDHTNPENPFQWDQVRMNLPGQFGYDPTLPWVYKQRKDGHLASELYLYVDDGRPTGYSDRQCWLASRRFCSMCSFLGIQDASRKRTSPSQTPGPWAGSVIHTDGKLVALISQKKWDKMKTMLAELTELMNAREDKKVPHKRLEQIRGFAIYVSRTYDWMPPYLKGLHLTIDSWRSGRKQDGWKAKKPKYKFVIWEWEGEQWLDVRPDEYAELTKDDDKTPELVLPVARLYRDVEALTELFSSETPSVSVLRPQGSMTTTAYLMGDASGKGFGSALWQEENIDWESGNYAQIMQSESSNFRESHNLTSRLEQLEKEGKILGKEIFVITDNMSFEGCFYKGHSTSEKLSDLILRIRMLQRRTGSLIHVVHVAGTRMKWAGIDGLSRGDLLEGMMQSSAHPLSFLPLSQSAEDRMPGKIKEWVDSWWQDGRGAPWGGAPLKLLSPADWFRLKNIDEPRLWVPPPTAMLTVLELFNDDRMTKPHLPHVFVVPRLMTHLWRKQLTKDADVVFTVQCDSSFWPAEMHEPLVVLIVFPLTFVDSYKGPWLVKGGAQATHTENTLDRGFKLWKAGRDDPSKLHELEGYLPSMWEGPEEWSRSVLLQLLDAAGKFPPVHECMVRGMLRGASTGPLSRSRSSGGRGRNRRQRIRGKSL